MKSDTFSLSAADATQLHVYRWLPEGEPRAVVQIAHGMAEHAARYEALAGRLVGEGYAVYAQDHRGHGRTAGAPERLGHVADSDGWSILVEDMAALTRRIREEQPGKPVVLLGHSMGSMLGRSYAIAHGRDIDGLILSGTAGDPGALGRVGRLVARIESRIRGKAAPSRLLDRLTFGQYGAQFKPARTRFDWLSRDQTEVDKYVADPLCGNVHSAQFFDDLLGGLAQINDPAQVARIPSTLPVYVFSGVQDPVGGKEAADVKAVVRQLREAGLEDVTERYYPQGRHEMLNETNRDEVYADILGWLDKHV